jgi:hypothetical protein
MKFYQIINIFKKLRIICADNFKRDYIKVISVFLLFFICFAYIYLSNEKLSSLDDQVFSIRYAELIKQQGPSVFSNFPWLHFSKIAEGHQLFSYDFLFYLVLTLFTFVKPLFLGIKIYGVVFAALSFAFLYYFFLKLKIKNPFLWVFMFLAFVSSAYTWKLLMARSFTIAPALLLLEIYLLHRKKYWGVFAVSIVYFFWHSATFFFPLVVAILYFGFDNLYTKKINWKIIYSCFSGLIISLLFIILAFSFSSFINFFGVVFGIYNDVIFGKAVQIAQGIELNKINALDFVKMYGIIAALFIISAVFEIYNYIRSKKNDINFHDEISPERHIVTSTLFFLSILFFLGSFLSGRNVDFFVYFSLAYIAISFDFFTRSIQWQSDLVKKSFQIGIIIVAIYFSIGNILEIKTTISQSEPIDTIEGSAEWLKNNTEKGTIVYTPTMNFFPPLFYYDTDNYYLVGAEPKLFYDYNSQMYWAWWHISNDGYLCFQESCTELNAKKNFMSRKEEGRKEWVKQQGNEIAAYIMNSFHSKYILTSSSFTNFNLILDNNENFEKAYTDDLYKKFIIYRIK